MTRMQDMFMAIYVVVAILSGVTSEINTQIPSNDVKIIVTQPAVKPPQVALAGRRRPILKPKPKPKPDGIVKPRPPHHKVVISPVMTPIPIYHIVVHHQHHKPVHIPKESCVKSTGESISSFCQALAARDFHPTSQNTTWETCCAAYIELDCYRQYAGHYCSKAERKALVDYSNNVANYFNSTICRAVAYRNWHYSCNRDTHLEESKKYKEEAQKNDNHKVKFIQLPTAFGTERTCFDKLANHTKGNWKSTCLKAALDIWDKDRHRLKDSYIYETCCAMHDALECIQTQANIVCTSEEARQVANYCRLSAASFTQGICRTVPFDRASLICRGAAFALVPSLVTYILVVAVMFVRKHWASF